jgi:hypothetical protein
LFMGYSNDEVLFLCFAGAGALAVMAYVFEPWLENRRQKNSVVRGRLREACQREKAIAIVQRGGPQTLDEVRLLFPDACWKCGFRSFSYHYSCTWQGDLSANNNPDERRVSECICLRCGSLTPVDPYKFEPDTETFCARSPFLSIEEQEAIGEFPFAPTGIDLAGPALSGVI